MESGKFWEFHDRLYEQFDTISETSILKIAVDLGFDKNDFQEKMKAPRITLMIQKDIQDAGKANVKGIPTVFINGKLQQKKTFADMQRHIDRELTQQGRP
jgi:protein-disulfide isomerase